MNVKNNLEALGVEVNLHTNKNWRQITKTRFIDLKTNHMFMRLDQRDDEYGKINLQDFDLQKYDAVIISDYNKGFMSEDDMDYISKNSKLSFLDTKRRLGSWCDDFSFIKINHLEYERTKSTITDKILKNLIVTRGPRGCAYNGKTYAVGLVEVKDTSGAGDTFVAALCFKYVLTGDMDKSIHFANECSTTVVQRMGVATI